VSSQRYGRPADLAAGDAPARLLDRNRERAAMIAD
jgi:hypothetical protein